MLGLFERLFTRRIDTEKAWLKELRAATEEWYNQLTEPLLPVLLKQVNLNAPDVKEKYSAIAEDLLKEVFVSNAGDVVRNLFQEMGNRGIPFVTSRDDLFPLIENYLQTGLFVKRLAYGFDPERARNQWGEFFQAKESLVSELNNQLRRLG